MADYYSDPQIVSSIVWGNDDAYGDADIDAYGNSAVTINYSDYGVFYPQSGGSASGTGFISVDPLFANPATNDFHLKSVDGRWDPTTSSWVTTDTVFSRCLVAGDPASNYSNEPSPNGSRINMGAYGNTSYASKHDSKMIIWVDGANLSSPWLGTEDDPYKTIQDGINAVRHAGTVYVKRGTGSYLERLSFTGSHKGFNLVGVEDPTYGYPQINGEDGGSVFTFSSVSNTIVVDGFTILNGQAVQGGGAYIYNSSPIIMNCNIASNLAYSASGPAYGGGLCIEYGSPIIYKCNINNNQAGSDDPSYDGVGGGIATVYSTATFIECNIGTSTLNQADDIYAGEIFTWSDGADDVPCYNDCPVRGGNAATSPWSSYLYAPKIDCDE